jgi:hypothetical protein
MFIAFMQKEEEMKNIGRKLIGNNVLVFMVAILLGVLTSGSARISAQEQEMYRIETTDGNTFIGQLIEEDDVKIVIRSDVLGVLTIQKANIKCKLF